MKKTKYDRGGQALSRTGGFALIMMLAIFVVA